MAVLFILEWQFTKMLGVFDMIIPVEKAILPLTLRIDFLERNANVSTCFLKEPSALTSQKMAK